MVVPRFVQMALANRPIPIYGDGEQSRCFCHVRDTVRAIIALMDRPEETSGEVYNIGNTGEVTINELAAAVTERTGSTSLPQHIPYSEAYAPGFEDMRRRVPDIGKIQRVTGWRPEATLTQILDDVIAFEKNRTQQESLGL